MFNFLKRKKNKNIEEIAKQELEENRGVFESFRDYDEGKKDISTDNVEERFTRVQTTLR